jgi:hypothetical protein
MHQQFTQRRRRIGLGQRTVLLEKPILIASLQLPVRETLDTPETTTH